MSAVRLVLVLWGTLFLLLGPLRSPGDGDLYWQRWLGDLVLQTHRLPLQLGAETFTSVGMPWVPQEWLFSVLVAVAMRTHEFLPFALLVSAIPPAILLSIYLRLRGRVEPGAIAIALFFCGVSMVDSFGIRAQVLGWGAFAAFLWALESRGRWFYALTPLVVALWANVHASVMIAPAIIAVRIAAAAVNEGMRGLIRNRDLRLLPLVLAALCCTPLGLRLPIYAVSLTSSPIRHFIAEWQPVSIGEFSFLFAGLPLALILALSGRRFVMRHLVEAAAPALLFVAMLFASRNIPLFAISAAPFAALSLSQNTEFLHKFVSHARRYEREVFIAIVIAGLLNACALTWTQRTAPQRLPIAAMSSLGAEQRDRRVFCEDYSWCSLALQFPRLRVFLDGRCDPYPLHIWETYISMIEVKRSWREHLRQYDVNAVLARRGSRFSHALASEPSWRTSYQDAQYTLYVRD